MNGREAPYMGFEQSRTIYEQRWTTVALISEADYPSMISELFSRFLILKIGW